MERWTRLLAYFSFGWSIGLTLNVTGVWTASTNNTGLTICLSVILNLLLLVVGILTVIRHSREIKERRRHVRR